MIFNIDIFSPFNIFILLGFFAAILMSAGFLLRPLHFRNILLSIFLLLFGYIMFYLSMIYTNAIYEYPHILLTNLPCMLVLGPVLLFYTLSITEDKKSLTLKNCIHFVPMFIILALLFSSYSLPAQEKIDILYKSMHVKTNIFYSTIEVFVISHMTVYFFASINRIRKAMKTRDTLNKKIKIFIILLCACIIVSIFSFIYINVSNEAIVLKIINVIISTVILGIFYLTQRYPYLLLYGIVPVRNRSYTKSQLSKVNIENLKTHLVTLMNEEKIYCDEDLTLPRLSGALEITPHQLSQFLNQHYDKNFNNFINEYRIAEAKEQLINEPERGLVSIAYSVGFNSYSAFASAFKKETGLAPAEFRKNKLL